MNAKESLEMYGIHEPLHPAALEDCVMELYERVEKLESITGPCPPDAIPAAEGHPIPDYDKIIQEAVEEADKEVDKLYEAVALNAAEEYVAAHLEFIKATKLSDKELREHNRRIQILHKAMVEAVEALE